MSQIGIKLSLVADVMSVAEVSSGESLQLSDTAVYVYIIHTMSHHHTYYVTSSYILCCTISISESLQWSDTAVYDEQCG